MGVLVVNKESVKRGKLPPHLNTRRPLCVGILPITPDLWQQKIPLEYQFSLYSSSESAFATLQDGRDSQ